MSKLTRRQFTKLAGFTGVALAAPGSRVLGANDDIRVAIIGAGGKGGQHLGHFGGMKGVRVVAVCDPDSKTLARRVADFGKRFEGRTVAGHVDFREVLDRDDVDAVCIATPNHWHALMTIYACQAGKDVYVEKPVSHTITESRKIAEAAEKYGRVVQRGTQNRSDRGLMEFFPWLHEGNLGKILAVRGLCYRDRTGIGKRDTPLTPPDSVDYNLWLGPGQDVPIYRPRFHYDWHWNWNTGNGDIGNQGPHEMDLIRWTLGDTELPSRVTCFGGRFGWNDAGETPNMQFAAYDYGDIPVFFEVRNMYLAPDKKQMPSFEGCRVGVVIHCEGGKFVGGRGGGWVYDKDNKRMRQFKGDGGGGHQGNFIDVVRSRKVEDLRAPIRDGWRSACLAHMANVACRVGDRLSPDALREQLQGDAAATETMERFGEHLAAWNIDYAKEPWSLGSSLEFDPKSLRFTGALADKANEFIHRPPREPFIIPETV